jgi:hypothetical protein
MSSYSNYMHRLEQLDREVASKFDLDEKQASVLKELGKVDPEGVVRWFESRPVGTQSSAALAEYLKALVKVDRLDESALLKTLHRGLHIVLSPKGIFPYHWKKIKVFSIVEIHFDKKALKIRNLFTFN